jgi:hypothetical protein
MGAAPAHKRTEVTIETDRVVTVRRRVSLRAYCRQCGRVVDAIGVEEAGALTGQKAPKLTDHTRAGAWHICEGWDGEMLICLDSVLKSL